MVKKNIILKRKFDLHQSLFKKIQDKNLKDDEFVKIAKSENNILNVKLNGINEKSKFDSDSIKLLYSLPRGSFSLITDDDNKIYLAKILNINSINLLNNNKETENYQFKSNSKIINNIYSSYDLSLNSKYKVKIFDTTLDRIKNYFK